MGRYTLITAVGLAILLLAAPEVVNAQTATDDQVEEQEYISLRFDVWSKDFRQVAEDGHGIKFTLALSTALFRYRTLDDLLNRDTEHINALGIRPKLALEYPTSIEHVSFVPEFELALNHSLDTSSKLLSAVAEAALLYRHHGDDKDFKVRIGAKYGTQSEQDGLNVEDYLELNLRLDLKRLDGLKIGQRKLAMTPFGQINHYTGDLTTPHCIRFSDKLPITCNC